MVATRNLNDFSEGGDIALTLSLKNRDGTALTNPATQTVDFIISDANSGDKLYEFDTTPEIELTNTPDSVWTVAIGRAAIPLLRSGIVYNYDVWSTSATDERLHQNEGAINLVASSEPA